MAKEYIERGALLEELNSLSVTVTGIRCGKGFLTEIIEHYKDSILRIINEQAAADVVEVVRCKDCKYWERYLAIGFESIRTDGSCKRLWAYHDAERCMTEENHFCSYGERKEE